MTLAAAWIVCGGAAACVAAFSVREILLYARDRKTRTDIYPYTRRRLFTRLAVSLLLISEALLLLPGRFTLRPDRPAWLALYVLLVVGLAAGMAVLALRDFRESQRLHRRSKERLLQEFVQGLQQDKDRIPPH